MTDEQMAELKAKHGKITTVEIPLDDENPEKVLTFHLRKPTRSDRRIINKALGGSLPEKAVSVGYNLLRVAGDEVAELEKNDDAFIAADIALSEILKVAQATIKKN
jgi:hypothetical protein